MDNRIGNLRFATQSEQNANHEVPRVDRNSPCLEVLELGISEYPLGMRYREDGSESRFDFEIRHAQDVNIAKRFSGTKSNEVSIVNKFRLACKQLLDDLLGAGYERGGDQERAHNTADYFAIAEAVHTACPKYFDKVTDDKASLRQIMYNRVGHVTDCLERLPPISDGEKLHGPLQQPQCILELSEIDAIAVQRPGCPVVLFDTAARRHVEAFGKIEVGNKSARLYENGEKRGLLEKVWVDVLERERPQGGRVVTTLGHHLDLRAANLIVADNKRQLDGNEQWSRAMRLKEEYLDAAAGLVPDQPIKLSELSEQEPLPHCGDKRARDQRPARQPQPFVKACGMRVLVDADAPQLPTLLADTSGVRVDHGKPRGMQLLREHVWDDYGLEADRTGRSGVVVPLNYSHQDVRKANLAKVFGIKNAQSFSPPRCELPEEVRAAAPKAWQGLLPFGLKYCFDKERNRHVFTVSRMIEVPKSGVPARWSPQTVKAIKFAGMQAALGKHYRSNVQLHGRDRFGPNDDVETVFREVNDPYVDAVQLARRELGLSGANVK